MQALRGTVELRTLADENKRPGTDGRRFVLLVPHNMPLTTAHLTDRWSILINVI